MFEEVIKEQRDYFKEGGTRNISERIEILNMLENIILTSQNDLIDAFIKDFNKHDFDVLSNEVSLVIDEIHYMKKHIKKFFKGKKVHSNLINFPSSGRIIPEPHGVCLVIAPWNYPFQLAFLPLVDAIACGNTVVLKPSELSPNVAQVMENMLKVFDSRLIKVIQGDGEVCSKLLDQKFDYIFFTGGDRIGRIVMEKASHNLTPVTLELGGKSPVIITKNCDIDLTAKRLAWGKYLNAGQTCVAPDYVLVDENIKEELIEHIIKYIQKFYYTDGKINDDFPYIINDRHKERVKNLIDPEKVVFGNKIDGRLIEPTILDNVSFDDKIMKEEIFGPLLPIISFKEIKEAIEEVKVLPRPLALYVFSNNKKECYEIINSISFGGGCINDVVMHLTNPALPFGGVGNSGMGSYHGYKSLITFTHQKSIFIKGKIEIQTKYPPITKSKMKLMKKFTNTEE